MGVSVTRRINEIRQPYGGYLNPKNFIATSFPTHKELKSENIVPSLVGLAVDYLTRFSISKDVEKAFSISLLGAQIGKYEKQANKLLKNIKLPLDSNTIISAVQLCGYDVIYRAGLIFYKPVEEIIPDENTIENILEMVHRSLNFFSRYGPIVCDGFTFENGGYTETVCHGDGDFLTNDTLWDFKVSTKKPNNKQTLQLLMYWIMGIHTRKPEFKNITKIGIFNPRLNIVFTYDLKNLSKEIIQQIENNVICY